MVGTQKREIDPTPLWIFVAYLLLTIGMTWPLARGLTRDVPGDLGDSLLNMWILGWGAENVPWLLAGQMPLEDFWNANIFHPEPLALSFSEHLFGQALQILPIYHLTGNLILAYNLLFVSTFVLSGIGMYLLARDLLTANDGRRPHAGARIRSFCWPAFVAGLVFAFVPYRIAQIAHIQLLSSQWMPFALFGFRRFIQRAAVAPPRFERASLAPLAGGTAGLLMQNWSCGYYLIYFAPFVVLFVIHQIVAAGAVRNWRVWTGFAAAAVVVTVGTWPFLSLYSQAQTVHGFERPLGEVIAYSADVYSYFTAPEPLRLWGTIIRASPRSEGELFFGFVPMVLAVVGIVGAGVQLVRREQTPSAPEPRWVGWTVAVLVAVGTVQLLAFFVVLLTGGFVTSAAGIPVRASNAARLLLQSAACMAVAGVFSRRARAILASVLRHPATAAAALCVFAVVLSLGPAPMAGGQRIPGLGLYEMLYEYVPGFNGLRVPARLAMIAALFLSVLAGYGAAFLLRGTRYGRSILAAAAVVFLIEASAIPFPINVSWGEGSIPDRVYPSSAAPPVYRQLASMSEAKVVTELPFGDPAWDLRYVYYSTVHWKRLVNGYSGAFPQGYKIRVARLQRIADDPEGAWQVLQETGTTHVVVHGTAYPAGRAETVRQWLVSHGAIEVGTYDSAWLFELPRRGSGTPNP